MGNENSGIFASYDWKVTESKRNYEIVEDTRTGIHAEKHIIPNCPKISDENELEIYKYRNQVKKPIVKVYGVEFQEPKAACGSMKNIIVYSEYIPYRLSDTINLTHGQLLYILSESLCGFEELYYRFGSFTITDDHIGFNEIGQCKVWNNPIFPSNRKEKDSILLMSTLNPKNFDQRMEEKLEEEMVEDIYLSVVKHGHIDPEFANHVNFFKNTDFLTARRLVSEEILKGRVYVSEYLNFPTIRRSLNPHNTSFPETQQNYGNSQSFAPSYGSSGYMNIDEPSTQFSSAVNNNFYAKY